VTQPARALAVFAAALVGVVLTVGGGSLWVLQSTVRAFEPARWSDDGVPREEALRVFGVRFPDRPATWRARQVNAQDASFEALALLGDGAAARRFLTANALEVDAEADADAALFLDAPEEELATLAGPVETRRVLKGALLDSPRFGRAAALLEVKGATWVALEAVER
jgi:hypothetical protein